MSFVGDPYTNDLFIGYSHGAALADDQVVGAEPPLRNWTRNVAREVAQRLEIGFSTYRDAGFHYFLDSQQASGAPLADDIEREAKSSALLLLFITPTYLRSPWSGQEIGWFFARADEDGRGLDHCVLRMAQPLPADCDCTWPERLTDKTGKPVTRGDSLYNPATGVPLDIRWDPAVRPPAQELDRAIDGLVAEIKVKLEALRKQLSARRASEPPKSREGIRATLYIQSYNDSESWSRARTMLQEVAFVTPERFEAIPDNLSMIKTFRERRQRALVDCNGLVLLRSSPADPLERLVVSSQFDRRVLQQTASHLVPWVLVDFVGDADPNELRLFDLPAVEARQEAWPDEALKALNL
ncbi:MAG: TIR domain-containing protein [Alphaproteobacteria bacterium]|nr:MAG: TIR domain-containing protein [Alphaproteobacteria bacterium]